MAEQSQELFIRFLRRVVQKFHPEPIPVLNTEISQLTKEVPVYQQAYYGHEYRSQDVMGASPLRLVVMAYDLAIRACEQEDFSRAIRAISVLRDALDFDYADVAVGLFRLYQWCLDCIRAQNYSEAIRTLKELRDAWASAEKQYTLIPPKVARITSSASRLTVSR